MYRETLEKNGYVIKNNGHRVINATYLCDECVVKLKEALNE